MVTLGDSRSAEGRSSVTCDLLVLCSSLFYGCYTIAIRRCVAVCILGASLLPDVHYLHNVLGPMTESLMPHGGCAFDSRLTVWSFLHQPTWTSMAFDHCGMDVGQPR